VSIKKGEKNQERSIAFQGFMAWSNRNLSVFGWYMSPYD